MNTNFTNTKLMELFTNKMLLEYIRDKRGNLIGAVVATPTNLNLKYASIGWSLCRQGDQFEKGLAVKIAFNRAKNGSNTSVPRSVEPAVERMYKRALRYFQGYEIMKP